MRICPSIIISLPHKQAYLGSELTAADGSNWVLQPASSGTVLLRDTEFAVVHSLPSSLTSDRSPSSSVDKTHNVDLACVFASSSWLSLSSSSSFSSTMEGNVIAGAMISPSSSGSTKPSRRLYVRSWSRSVAHRWENSGYMSRTSLRPFRWMHCRSQYVNDFTSQLDFITGSS